MSLVAYYDESGTHDGSAVTVLAGFAARPAEWVPFEREWKKILKKWNLPYVHAKPLFHKQKHYKGWTDKKVRELWADILYVIQEREVFATRTVLYEDDYKTFYVMDGPAKRERLDSRYALCFRSLLHSLPSAYKVHYSGDDFHFVLEAGHRNAGDALRVFKELKRDPSFEHNGIIGNSVAFGSKPDWCALQAADLLAYWCFKAECESDDDDRGMLISDLEIEILETKLAIVEHLITPADLGQLRKNFLRKRKLPVFQQVRLDDDADPTRIDGSEFFHLDRRYDG